jgi:V8-like Glu-specific endopeptidase
MARKPKHPPADHQQENPGDPVLAPDLGRIKALAEMAESADDGPMPWDAIRESICGMTDDSQPVEQYDGTLGVSRAFVDQHQRPVGQLRWNSNLASIYSNPGNVSGVRWGTGALISDNLFLTAGHCFDQSGGGWQRPRVNGTTNIIAPAEIATNMSVEFNYQVDQNGVLRTAVSVPVVELIEYRLGGLDFAIVRLAGTPGQTWGRARLAAADANVGDMLCIIGHPAGQPKRIEAGPLTLFEGDRIRYNDIDTLGGNSGSCILRELSGEVVGVHTNGGCNAAMTGSNFGVRISALLRESPTLRNLPTATNVIADVLATSIQADVIPTSATLDRPTTALADRFTNLLADRATSVLQDVSTTVVTDRPTSALLDLGTSPIGDQPGTIKSIDDVKGSGLDKQFQDTKVPGLDGRFDPGLAGRVNPVQAAGAISAQPFVLATPHHAPGLAQTAETRMVYEQAISQLEVVIEALSAHVAQLHVEHEALIAEYRQAMGG